MSEDCRRKLPDPTFLVRGIRKDEISKQTGRIKKGAFVPRRNGKDDDGLSVSQPGNDNHEQLMARMENSSGLLCGLVAGNVRTIQEGNVSLEVCPNATERDPLHCLIQGVPTNSEASAMANRLAERLAQISNPYEPTV